MNWMVAGILLLATTAHAQMAGAFLTGATGQGVARWTRDGDTLTYRGGATFAWAVMRGTALRDGFVQVRFRPVAGREDQAGGVVWRWRDANNYYVARGNALEGNVVAYKVVDGRRADLPPLGVGIRTYGVKVPVGASAWHTLRVDFAGSESRVTLDGRALFRVRDTTFEGPGAVGVWSKADSVTEFDTFEYEGK